MIQLVRLLSCLIVFTFGNDIFIEAPPEVFDSRSLYEKLKVQHDAKKKEFEDTWAASNQNESCLIC